MGAGFSRLNSLTIIQTSQGLAEYILSHHPTAQKSGVVIGCDARHNSKRFAEQVATVFLSKGFRVWWFGTTVHTPLVPFTVKKSQAAVGVMVTASHNPAQDNGYKVYGANGCQINAPVDQEITASILMNLEPLTWGQSSPSIAIAENRMILIRQKMLRLYTEEIVSFGTELGGYVRNKPPAFVYTPMHGVGYDYLDHVLQEMAHRSIMEASMSVVQEQNRPDPDFPTIRYPNPEEDGALDLAKAKADSLGRRIIIANDPDADRLAVAEKVDGKWIQFTGDQVGVLLGYYLISNMSRTPGGKVRMSKSYMLASAVSSQMLSRIISATALSFGETLTGFKWLGTKALRQYTPETFSPAAVQYSAGRSREYRKSEADCDASYSTPESRSPLSVRLRRGIRLHVPLHCARQRWYSGRNSLSVGMFSVAISLGHSAVAIQDLWLLCDQEHILEIYETFHSRRIIPGYQAAWRAIPRDRGQPQGAAVARSRC